MNLSPLINRVRESLKKTVLYKYKDYILFGVVVILSLLMYFRRSHDIIAISPLNQDLIQQVKTLKDANGKSLAQIEQIVISEQEAKLRADSLAKALKIKPKYIKGQDYYTTKVDTFFSVVTSPVYLPSGDTAYKVEKHDAYVDIEAIAGKSTGTISYRSKDTITRVETIKNPLIGSTKRTITLRSANPYNTIVDGYSWSVKEKEVWLAIGPSVQYNPFTKKVDIGVSIQIPIFKLKR